MSDVQVRPFRRGDRDQLTMLVNAHAGAVVPGMSGTAQPRRRRRAPAQVLPR